MSARLEAWDIRDSVDFLLSVEDIEAWWLLGWSRIMYLTLSNSLASLVVIRFKEIMKNKISLSSSSAAENYYSSIIGY